MAGSSSGIGRATRKPRRAEIVRCPCSAGRGVEPLWSLPDAFPVVAGSEQRITFRKTDPLLTLLAFDTICWKVAPVRPKDASIDIISQRFKFLDFGRRIGARLRIITRPTLLESEWNDSSAGYHALN